MPQEVWTRSMLSMSIWREPGNSAVVEVSGEERVVFVVAAAGDDAGVAVEAEDHGAVFEGAEHQGEAVVGGAGGLGGLVAAAGAVEVDDGVAGVEDAESGELSRGETLTRPSGAAEALKKMCWRSMKSSR